MKIRFKFLMILIGVFSLSLSAQVNVQSIKSLKCYGALYDSAKDASKYSYLDFKYELSLQSGNKLKLIEAASKKDLGQITIASISKRISLSDNKSYMYTFKFSDNNNKALLLIPRLNDPKKAGKFHATGNIGDFATLVFDMCDLKE